MSGMYAGDIRQGTGYPEKTLPLTTVRDGDRVVNVNDY